MYTYLYIYIYIYIYIYTNTPLYVKRNTYTHTCQQTSLYIYNLQIVLIAWITWTLLSSVLIALASYPIWYTASSTQR